MKRNFYGSPFRHLLFFYLITAYYAGLYDRWYKRSELVRSTLLATIVLLAAYSLLPEQYRFSRGIILFGALLAFVLISILRWILVQTNVLSSNQYKNDKPNTFIAGSAEEYEQDSAVIKGGRIAGKSTGQGSGYRK